MDEGLELIDQRPAGNTYAILFDSMYAANVVEGNWMARTNVDAVNRTAALLVEVRRRNDVRLIHVKGHSADGENDRADELAWWGSTTRHLFFVVKNIYIWKIGKIRSDRRHRPPTIF